MPSTPPSRQYAGESLVNRQTRRKQQFMQAGLQLFGTHGYRKTTVRMLCQEAGLTDRYFYESFDSTEDLLVAVYEAQMGALGEAINAALADAMPKGADAAIQAGLNAVFSLVADPRVGRVFLLEILGVSPRVDAAYMRNFKGFADAMVMLARHLYPAIDLSEDEARMVGLALIGAVSQSATYWMLGQYKESQSTLVSANARIIQGLLISMT